MHLILAARELWVLLYQTLQPDTVELGYAVEAVAGTDVVGMVFILLWSTLALLLQPYNLAHLEVVAVFPLVPFCYLPTRDSYLLADGLEGVAATDLDIVVVVIPADGVENALRSDGPVLLGPFDHELIVIAGLVVLVELIELNDVDELLGIAWIGGIAGSLQAVGPGAIVGAVEGEQAAVAAATTKEQAVVLVALLSIVVGTETLAHGIIVMIYRAPRPAVTLYAEVVVALEGQLAEARSALQYALGKGDTRRNAILEHLLDGKVLILVYIILISRVPTILRTCHNMCHERKQKNH